MPQANPYAIAAVFVILGSILGAWTWAIVRLAMRLPVLPPNTPRIVPWGGWSVLMVLFATMVIQVASLIGYNVATTGKPVGMPVAGGMPSPKSMMTVTLLFNAATVVVIPFLLWLTSGATAKDFGLRFAGLGRQVMRGMVTYPLLAPVVFGTMFVAVMVYGKTDHPLEKAIASAMTPGMAVVMVLAGVVGAPVAEEFLFRGVLLGWLTRVAIGGKKKPGRPEELGEVLLIEVEEGGFVVEQGPNEGYVPADFGSASMNPYEAPQTAILSSPEPVDPDVVTTTRYGPLLAANVATSLVFAALHAPVWPTPIPIFFLSLGLGVLYQRTGSILAPIALHMTFNGVSTMMMFLALGGEPAPQAPAPDPKVIKTNLPPATIETGLRALGDGSRFLNENRKNRSDDGLTVRSRPDIFVYPRA